MDGEPANPLFTSVASSATFDCNTGCRSQQHAAQLFSAITKGTDRQILLFLSRCHSPGSITDESGRTALHLAASCGRDAIVEWLISEQGASVAATDRESGWSALHRALFYGQLSTARLLIAHGSSLWQRDREGLTPLDVVMKDRLPHVDFLHTGLEELFTWGANFNFTLGHENMQPRKLPEQIEVFRKQTISIKKVAMSKYHSVFLSDAGQVYTCGHGLGGRLGQGDEQTYLVPKMLDVLKKEICVDVAAATNHTVMLMENGTVYSCGMNNYHQLGQFPPPERSPTPKLVNGKQLKGRQIVGVCAQRFHSVFYTADSVFTCGLNAGQLGHYKISGENLVSQPRPVSALCNKDTHIQLVTASDAATVVVTTRGDVYALHEYQCRKIVSKWLDVVQVRCTGGHLDHSMDAESLNEHGGSPLTVALLTTSGKVFLCLASGDSVIRRCVWSVGRPIFVTDLSTSSDVLVFATKDGEAFSGNLKKAAEADNVAKAITPMKECHRFDTFSLTLSDLVQKDDVIDISVSRIALVHRATSVSTDQQGTNISVLQSHPNASVICIPCVQPSEMKTHLDALRSDAHQDDTIHDIMLQVGYEKIPAHRFILAQRSEYFRSKFHISTAEEGLKTANGSSTVLNVDLRGRPPFVFRQLLQFIYTNSCDFLSPGNRIQLYGMSDAHPAATQLPGSRVNKNAKKKGKRSGGQAKDAASIEETVTADPIEVLKEMAREFGVINLVKRLETVQCIDGYVISIPDRSVPFSPLRFERKNDGLNDVFIESEDGVMIACHKCILASRLEYFRSMFSSAWIEMSESTTLRLPLPSDVLKIIIDFLYTDQCVDVEGSCDTDLLCHVLVASDQLLIGRLRDECEVALARLLTLRNACELLEFATLYNATQLAETCQQFICINLAALLETRALDVLSDEVTKKLTEYYKNTVTGMNRRVITPYSCWPDTILLESLERSEDDCTRTKNTGSTPVILKKQGLQQRRRPRMKSLEAFGEARKHLSSISGEDARDKAVKSVVIVEEEEKEELSAGSVVSLASSPPSAEMTAAGQKSLPLESPVTVTKPSGQSSSSSPHLPLQRATEKPRSLRDIISEEASKDQSSHTIGDHNSSAISSRNSKKVSQRERKRQDQAAKTPDSTVTPSENKAAASSHSPWKQVEAVVQSFRDLLLTEKTQQEKVSAAHSTPSSASKAKATSTVPNLTKSESSQFSWGGRSGSSSSLQLTPGSPTSEPTSPVDRPWIRSPKISESGRSDGVPASFNDILRDEMAQTQTLKRATNKSLSLIQIEEQAMSALLEYYRASDNYHEYITVERVPSKNARPLWQATQRQTSTHLF